MLGILFMASAMLLTEISDSLGKRAVQHHTQSIYTMGFLSIFWSAIFLIAVGIWRHSFIFSLASLPIFTVRSILEILQLHIGILAVVKAERGSYGFIRTMTVPLLLLADLALGYAVGSKQIIGIIIIFLALIILFLDHGINRRGIGFVIFSAVNAVITISLFKYDIAHFNSVEAEQSIMYLILMIYLFFGAYFMHKENPLAALKNPLFFIQASTSGAGGVLGNFAYTFASASVITAAQRSFAVLWSILSGSFYFNERQIRQKIFSLVLIVLGLILLI